MWYCFLLFIGIGAIENEQEWAVRHRKDGKGMINIPFANDADLKKFDRIVFVKTPGLIVTHIIEQNKKQNNYEQEKQLVLG